MPAFSTCSHCPLPIHRGDGRLRDGRGLPERVHGPPDDYGSGAGGDRARVRDGDARSGRDRHCHPDARRLRAGDAAEGDSARDRRPVRARCAPQHRGHGPAASRCTSAPTPRPLSCSCRSSSCSSSRPSSCRSTSSPAGCTPSRWSTRSRGCSRPGEASTSGVSKDVLWAYGALVVMLVLGTAPASADPGRHSRGLIFL